MRIKWPLKLLLALVVLGIGLAAAGYDLKFLRQKALSFCRVRIEKVELQQDSSLLSGDATGTFTLAVSNPYPISMTIKHAHFKLFAGPNEIGLAEMATFPSVKIQAMGRTLVPMQVEVDLSRALPALMATARDSLKEMKLGDIGAIFQSASEGNMREALRRLSLDLRVEGDVTVETPFGDAKLPLRTGKRRPNPAQPQAPATGVSEYDTEQDAAGDEVRKW